MKKVYQTEFGEPRGNCLQAAIASILERGLDEVPHFVLCEDWFEQLEKFMDQFGLQPVDVTLNDWVPEGYYIGNGPSPRGYQHSVVFKGPTLVHDPHPENMGLVRVDTVTLFIDKMENVSRYGL